MALEVESPYVPDISFSPDFSYGDPEYPSSIVYNDSTLQNTGGYWGSADTVWGNFYWDGAIIGEAVAYLDGSGRNISMLIAGSSTYGLPHKIHEVTIHYGIRGLKI